MKETNIKLLVAIRESGMTQGEVADKLGATNAMVSLWVHGTMPHKKYRKSVNELFGQEIYECPKQ
jgi:predicted transcriptional regulator